MNTVRLIAALNVLYGHVIFHLQISEPPVFNEIIRFFYGVPIFFTLSGYLIWGSIGRSKNYKDFLMKRFWRVYPELWVAVIVEIVVMLLLYNKPINLVQFMAFCFGQLTLFQFWTPGCLRDYGCGCPNGALWTICVIVQFYIIAYPIYKALHGKSLTKWILTIASAIVLGFLIPLIQTAAGETAGKLYGVTVLPFLWMFLIAALVAEKKDIVLPILKKYWAAIISVLLIVLYTKLDINASYGIMNTTLLFLGLLGVAYAMPWANIRTDVSYGVYIYHMTIVNALLEKGYMHYWWLLIVVMISTLIVAWISTKTIGKWSLSKKS